MDDREFIQKCVNGDIQAQTELVNAYSRLIFSSVLHTLRAYNPSLAHPQYAEDIVQDIFVNLAKNSYHKLATFQGKNNCTLASWLRQVSANYTIDCLRRLKSNISIDEEFSDGSTLKDFLADKRESVKDSLSLQDKLDQLSDCIEKLKPQERFFIQFSLRQGLGIEEVSRLWGIKRGALDMRKSRIIEKLRECFGRKGFL